MMRLLLLSAALGISLPTSAEPLPKPLPKPPLVKPGAPGKPSTALTVEESVALGQSRYTPADARFMQMMMVHHQQAVDMGALIDGRSVYDDVALMARRIAISQTSEIEMMRTWLERRGEPTTNPHAHHMQAMQMKDGAPSDQPMMRGMLSPRQMVELEAASGTEFDRLWLSGMIEHHEGAIFMVEQLMQEPGNGEDPELSEFLAAIVADQNAEIARMQSMLAELDRKEPPAAD